MPVTGQYYYSDATLQKAIDYLTELNQSTKQPGGYLRRILYQNGADFKDLTPEALIVHLMNTRQPTIFAESAPVLNGSDWNQDETSILGDISFSTTGTKAYNNGAHNNAFTPHNPPLDVHLIYAAGTLLANGHGTMTSDMAEVVLSSGINEEALYQLYERRLLPGLLAQNEQARVDGKRLVINIPGMGCGMFAGEYEEEIRGALPKALQSIFKNHADALDRVSVVNYDPFLPNGTKGQETLSIERSSGENLNFMIRPLQDLPQAQKASQLEFPKDGADYNNGDFRLVKIVAWDHFSYPGNDIWRDSRATDDGVTAASTNTFEAMIKCGQFGGDRQADECQMDYTSGTGIARIIKNGTPISYAQFAAENKSCVLLDHLTQINIPAKREEQVAVASAGGVVSSVGIAKPFILEDLYGNNYVDSVERNQEGNGYIFHGRNARNEPRSMTIYDDGDVSSIGAGIAKTIYDKARTIRNSGTGQLALSEVCMQMFDNKEKIFNHFNIPAPVLQEPLAQIKTPARPKEQDAVASIGANQHELLFTEVAPARTIRPFILPDPEFGNNYVTSVERNPENNGYIFKGMNASEKERSMIIYDDGDISSIGADIAKTTYDKARTIINSNTGELALSVVCMQMFIHKEEILNHFRIEAASEKQSGKKGGGCSIS
jgi:hypothetical protein